MNQFFFFATNCTFGHKWTWRSFKEWPFVFCLDRQKLTFSRVLSGVMDIPIIGGRAKKENWKQGTSQPTGPKDVQIGGNGRVTM